MATISLNEYLGCQQRESPGKQTQDLVQAAREHLQPADLQPFPQAMRDAGLNPTVPFEKDILLVRISKFRIDFEHCMVLVGPPAAMDQHLNIRDPAAGTPGAAINDTIKRMGGR